MSKLKHIASLIDICRSFMNYNQSLIENLDGNNQRDNDYCVQSISNIGKLLEDIGKAIEQCLPSSSVDNKVNQGKLMVVVRRYQETKRLLAEMEEQRAANFSKKPYGKFKRFKEYLQNFFN